MIRQLIIAMYLSAAFTAPQGLARGHAVTDRQPEHPAEHLLVERGTALDPITERIRELDRDGDGFLSADELQPSASRRS